jgi:hypothetical protein
MKEILIALLIAGSCCDSAFAAKPDADQPDVDAPSPKPKNVHKQSAPKTPTPDSERPSKARRNEPALSKVEQDDDDSTAAATNVHARKVPAHVEKIRAEHQKFQAKPSAMIASAQFNPDYRITAAQNWEGAPYEVFRSYQPQWHDEEWYLSRYNKNVQLIAGGWYCWEGGYWFPAWGYDTSAAYYPYDGPIYVGQNPRPFDQVVADIQTLLQKQGYYRGEVDGLLGPQTQAALAAYQTAHGLPPTAVLDQPTVDSLGLSE